MSVEQLNVVGPNVVPNKPAWSVMPKSGQNALPGCSVLIL